LRPFGGRSTEKNVAQPASLFTLTIVSGSLQGREFALGAEGECIIGRSEARLDVSLHDEAVSREHARIWVRGAQARIRDSRSSNGTFVNGTRVHEALLRAGDKIMMGNTVAQLRAHEAYALPPSASGRTPTRAALSGTVPETGLDDVLRMLIALQKDVVVHVRTENRAACIRVAQGRVCQAVIRGANFLPARKALFRVLSWQNAAFETHMAHVCEDAIREPLDALLVEAARQRDEIARVEARLPQGAAILVLGVNEVPPLSIDEQLVLDTIAHHRLFQAVLNRSPLDDATTAQTVVTMQERDLLLAVEPSRTAFLVPDVRHAIFGRRSDPTPVHGQPTSSVRLARIARMPEPPKPPKN
jgi:hypothetical protein